jgi:hypothetical protein
MGTINSEIFLLTTFFWNSKHPSFTSPATWIDNFAKLSIILTLITQRGKLKFKYTCIHFHLLLTNFVKHLYKVDSIEIHMKYVVLRFFYTKIKFIHISIIVLYNIFYFQFTTISLWLFVSFCDKEPKLFTLPCFHLCQFTTWWILNNFNQLLTFDLVIKLVINF